MKKLMFTPFLFIALIVNAQENKEAIDQKFGFRNVKLETKLNEFPQFKKIEYGDGYTFYENPKEDKHLGSYELDNVTYVFYEFTLAQIMIQSKGLINSDGLLKVLQELYGKGFKGNQYIDRYLWKGNKASIYYNKNSITDDALIVIFSNKLKDKKEADDKLKNQKIAKDAF